MPTLTLRRTDTTTISNSIGLFGKIPARGDFVRYNLDATGRTLASWIEAATETCHLHDRGLPTETLHALFRSADSPALVAATLTPSVDSVGRRFPLTVFCEVDPSGAWDFPAHFVASRQFHWQAADLAVGAGESSMQQLEDGLGQLAVTTREKTAAAAERVRGILAHATQQSHIQPLFGDIGDRRHHYAFRTLAIACQQSHSARLDKPGITLGCPCRSEAHQIAWLELIRRLCGTLPHPPGIVWTMAPERTSYGSMTIDAAQQPARLHVSFGSIPAMTFSFLSNKPVESSGLWPLWSDNRTAIEAATAALSEEQRLALDNEAATLEQILNSFSI
jgi:type VI secretion system protein ImpM